MSNLLSKLKPDLKNVLEGGEIPVIEGINEIENLVFKEKNFYTHEYENLNDIKFELQYSNEKIAFIEKVKAQLKKIWSGLSSLDKSDKNFLIEMRKITEATNSQIASRIKKYKELELKCTILQDEISIILGKCVTRSD